MTRLEFRARALDLIKQWGIENLIREWGAGCPSEEVYAELADRITILAGYFEPEQEASR